MKYVLPLLVLLLAFGPSADARAQSGEGPPKEEFRGAWIASVVNLDWPRTNNTTSRLQQLDLTYMLEQLHEAGVNAVMFQVRPECDALYDSPFEPWSYWLTGQSGKAPDPFFDPLEQAVADAHRLGMEIHAWFNPFRCERSVGAFPLAENHPAREHPDWILNFGGKQKLLDPGLQEVRDFGAAIIADVVRRYDVDGVHFDDYFYPYPPNQITNEDDATFAEHNRGFTNRGDWRRDNINLFVAQVQDSINALKPWVKYGISPFGIWKNGVPSGIVGLDAHNVIYGDALAWIDAHDIDYLAPQLYWQFGGGQDYGKLAPWWGSVADGVHVYPGHIFRSNYATREVPRQLRFNRGVEGLQGSILFRATNVARSNTMGIVDTLQNDLWRYPALTPTMAWKDQTPPPLPRDLTFTLEGEEDVVLTWKAPLPAENRAEARRYAVYRVRTSEAPDFNEAMQDARNLIAVTGDTTYTDDPGIADDPYYYVVTAVSANSIESGHSNFVVTEGRAVSTETLAPVAFALEQNYPNPFSSTTEIGYRLDVPGTVRLEVYDVLGRRVSALVDGAFQATGTYTARWDGTDAGGRTLGSGTYFYVLSVDGRRVTKAMVRVR